MKNFNQFILTLLAAGLFASCSLTEEPTSFVNRKSFYKNESQCIAALNSCYMPANAIYTANFMLSPRPAPTSGTPPRRPSTPAST